MTRIFDSRNLGPILLFAAMLAGCGLFETRDPEPPTGGSATFVPPTSPDIVLDNLENAVAERNTENYVRCLVDTLNSGQRFVFYPTSPAAGRYAATFSSWGLQSERAWFAALKALSPKDAPAYLNLEGDFAVIAADSAIYEGKYELVIRHAVANVSETVRGNLQFVLHTDRNSIWSITRWTDISLQDETSWSEWKGRFAN
jgi:hypothetical protein